MRKVKPFTIAPPWELIGHALRGEVGRHWYRQAYAQVVAGAVVLDITPQRFADLLALFSPRVSVMKSIRLAIEYAKTGTMLYNVLPNVRASVEHYEATGEIRGPKTSAFSRAIMGDEDAVVLDVWMGEALGIPGKRFEVKTIREAGEQAIRDVAEYLSWTPAQTQAAIWTSAVQSDARRVTAPELLIEPEL